MPNQPSASAEVDRLRELSAFAGDSAQALRTLHAFFAADFPACTLALMLVHDEPSGSARLAGLIGADGSEHVANIDPFNEQGALPHFADALCRQLFSDEARPQVLNLVPASRGTPLAQALFGPATVLAVPVINAGEISHWLLLASTLAGRFENVDLVQVITLFNLAANLVIRQLALRLLTAETTRQRAAIEGLADAQRLLLPEAPNIGGLDYAAHWQPAETAAGDYYDLSNLSHLAEPALPPDSADMWAVMLADVSGHGAAAAMEGAQFDAILRTYRGDEPPGGPAGVITYANRHFFSRRQRQHFLTVFAALYRPLESSLDYVCAGHPPALLRRGASTHWLGDSDAGIPLGVLRDHRWDNATIDLEVGDVLLVYTDGIVEARNGHGEMFGRERLAALLADFSDAKAADIRDSLVAAVQEHQGSTTGADDQTLIVLRLNAAGGSAKPVARAAS